MKTKLIAINGRYTHSCLALFYIRNELELYCESVDIDLLQFSINDPYYEMLLTISGQSPEVLFFSTYIWNSDKMIQLINDLGKILPLCKMVIGGPQGEIVKERVRQDSTVIIGDIETVGNDFYKDLQNDTLASVYNGGTVQKQQYAFKSPYRETDFELYLKNRHIYYESSRGCPFSCSYCLSSAEVGVYHKELDLVKSELSFILKFNPTIIRFVDRTFNDNPARVMAIWKFLLSVESETLFHFEIAPDIFNEEMFDLLATVPPGKFQFEIGVQSTNKDSLEAVCRKVDHQAAHNTISRISDFDNIYIHADLILGLPFETKQTFADSFRDIFKMRPHYIQMGLLKLLPNTKISKQAKEYGYIKCDNPPYAVLASKWMGQVTLAEMYWFCEIVEKFINNRFFTSVWKYLRSRDEDIYLFFDGLLKVGIEKDLFVLSATHRFMIKILLKYIKDRDDGEFIMELILYDWLRCGNRFFPKSLESFFADNDPYEIKRRLYEKMPDIMEGVYTHKERSMFFRKSFFVRFSQKTLKETGFTFVGDYGYLCFSAEKEENLQKYNKVLFIPKI